jgi:hypothetical protein
MVSDAVGDLTVFRVPRVRDYQKEATEGALTGTLVDKHPLYVEPKVESPVTSPLFTEKTKTEKVSDLFQVDSHQDFRSSCFSCSEFCSNYV